MRAPRAPTGFTLVEMLVVLALVAMVGGALARLVVGQQRFYRGASEMLEVRQQLRQGAAILSAELRGVSAAGGDVASRSSTAIGLRTGAGAAVVCEVLASGAIAVPPLALASGAVLTTWLGRPAVGDTLFLLGEPAPGDDRERWTAHRVVVVDSVATGACPPTASPAFTLPADAARHRHRFALSPGPSADVRPGTAVRFTRRVRYALYRASDGGWYLGHDQYADGAWAGIQPVSGPYLRGDSTIAPSRRGLELRYFDERGVEVRGVAGAARIARVDFVLRAASRRPVRLGDAPAAPFEDSLATSVALRNR